MPRSKASGLAAVLAVGSLAVLPGAPAGAATPLASKLARAMRGAGAASGAYVVDATDGTTVFSRRSGSPRVLASNTKLFTSSAALARFGVDGTLGTEVRGLGSLVDEGVFQG